MKKLSECIAFVISKIVYYILAVIVRIPVAVFLFVYTGIAVTTTDRLCDVNWVIKLRDWYKNV